MTKIAPEEEPERPNLDNVRNEYYALCVCDDLAKILNEDNNLLAEGTRIVSKLELYKYLASRQWAGVFSGLPLEILVAVYTNSCRADDSYGFKNLMNAKVHLKALDDNMMLLYHKEVADRVDENLMKKFDAAVASGIAMTEKVVHKH